jgi:hypothetical protein
MTSEQQNPEVIQHPASRKPINFPRPPIDWGGEEPDEFWEDLYYRGLVDPPYRSGKDFVDFMKVFLKDRKPVGKPMSDDELMCALGRCHCATCE